MKRTTEVSKPRRVYIEELELPLSAASLEKATTMAVGEEALKGDVTTLAIGEECLKS